MSGKTVLPALPIAPMLPCLVMDTLYLISTPNAAAFSCATFPPHPPLARLDAAFAACVTRAVYSDCPHLIFRLFSAVFLVCVGMRRRGPLFGSQATRGSHGPIMIGSSSTKVKTSSRTATASSSMSARVRAGGDTRV